MATTLEDAKVEIRIDDDEARRKLAALNVREERESAEREESRGRQDRRDQRPSSRGGTAAAAAGGTFARTAGRAALLASAAAGATLAVDLAGQTTIPFLSGAAGGTIRSVSEFLRSRLGIDPDVWRDTVGDLGLPSVVDQVLDRIQPHLDALGKRIDELLALAQSTAQTAELIRGAALLGVDPDRLLPEAKAVFSQSHAYHNWVAGMKRHGRKVLWEQYGQAMGDLLYSWSLSSHK